MKTERRHELQTNILADWLGQHLEQLRPYSTQIGVAVGAIAIAALAGIYFMNENSARSGAGWTDFYAAYDQAISEQRPDRLQAVAEDHPGTLPALWAYLAEGDLALARGIQLLYTDRTAAGESLKNAEVKYQAALTGVGSSPDLEQSALFGLAQVYESQSNVDEAIQYYERVLQMDSDSARGQEAEQRLAMLSDPDTADFYAWFAEQKPLVPSLGSAPLDSGPQLNFPADFGSLTDTPDSDFLDAAGITTPESEFPMSETPESETPELETPESETSQSEDETSADSGPGLNAPEPAADAAADNSEPAETNSNEP